jgi:hypothetical protein
MPRPVALFLTLGMLAGCASDGMSQAECRLADWHAIGYEDGSQGRGPGAIGQHRAACAEHGVAMELEPYLAGHREGLESYCHPRNGSALGERGYRYEGICPEELEEAFVAAYEDARGLYVRRSRLAGLRRSLVANQARAERVELLLVEKTAEVLKPMLAPSRRATLAVELKQLGQERAQLEDVIHGLEHDCDEAQAEYDRYRVEMEPARL